MHELTQQCLVGPTIDYPDSVPEEKKAKGRYLQKEVMLLEKQLLNFTKQIIGVFAKTLTTTVCLRKYA